MKKKQLKSTLGLKKSIVSNLNASEIKGGLPIGPESEDRLNCVTENCTQGCVTRLFTNCNQCPTAC